MSRLPPGGAVRVRHARSPEPEALVGPGARPRDRLEEPEARRRRAIDALLLDLGSHLRRADGAGGIGAAERRPTGIPEIDRLLGGGFPIGSLCEITGGLSSGRTSLALALLATTTRAGELAGLVDTSDAFDPLSAARAGVDLERVLWVRARSWQEALRSGERLIRTEGFPLVVLDGTAIRERGPGRGQRTAPPPAAWIRLTRLAAGTRTAVVLLSSERLAGSHAGLALEMQPARARFTGTPALLEALQTRALLVRHRAEPIDRDASFALRSRLRDESAA